MNGQYQETNKKRGYFQFNPNLSQNTRWINTDKNKLKALSVQNKPEPLEKKEGIREAGN